MDIKALRESVKDLSILFVEDEEAVRMGTLNLINKFFTTIHTATNGLEGLELFEKHKDIDIILSDIKMPKLDGFKMVQKIKSLKSDVYVVFLTGSMEEYKNELDFDYEVIIKPISYENLIETLHNINQYFSK